MDNIYTQSSVSTISNFTQLHEFSQYHGDYEGELKENIKNGLGIFIWKNGDAYFGSWLDDKMHGKGIFCFNTGHYIEAIFNSNFVDGPACITYPDGSFLKGTFEKGDLSGRILIYEAEKDSWVLQEYESGMMKKVYYEGNGKPMSYSKAKVTVKFIGIGVCVSTYEEDPVDISTRKDETPYKIQGMKKDLVGPYAIGCIEIDADTRHYGFVKNKIIEGLGIRINKTYIEVGKYRNETLEGYGRRLEFGNRLYEGEFIQGKYYGKGSLYDWRDKTVTEGVFTAGILMHKNKDQPFSIQGLNVLHPYNEHTEVIKLNVRNYQDTFAKRYSDKDKEDNSKFVATTIKEIAYATVVSKETVIEHYEVAKDSLQNSPARKALRESASNLAKLINADDKDSCNVNTALQASQSYIDQLKQNFDDSEYKLKLNRSSIERSLEPAFSQVFSIGVNERLAAEKNQRSASRDAAARYSNITLNYPWDYIATVEQATDNTALNLAKPNISENGNELVSSTSLPRAVDQNRREEAVYGTEDFRSTQIYDSNLNFAKRFSYKSPPTNLWQTQDQSYSTINFTSNGMPVENGGFKYELSQESVSPYVERSRNTETDTRYTFAEDQPKKHGLLGDGRNAKSVTNLHALAQNALGDNPAPSQRDPKTSRLSNGRDSKPLNKHGLTVITRKLSAEKSNSSLTSARTLTSTGIKLPSELQVKNVTSSRLSTNINTPTKNNKGGPSTPGRTGTVNPTIVKKGSGSNLKVSVQGPNKKDSLNVRSKTPTSSKTAKKDGHSLVYVGNSPYVKKSSISFPKNEILIPKEGVVGKKNDWYYTSTAKRSINSNDNVGGQEYTIRKSPSNGRTVERSSAHVVEVDLHGFASGAKTQPESRESFKQGFERSGYENLPTNVWANNKSSHHVYQEYNSVNPDRFSFEGPTRKSSGNERFADNAHSSRNKSPITSNVVNIDISMFRPGNQGGNYDSDNNRLKIGADYQSGAHNAGPNDLFNGGPGYNYSNGGYFRESEAGKQSSSYSFMPAREILDNLGQRQDIRNSNRFGNDILTQNGKEEKRALELDVALANAIHPLNDKGQNNSVHTFDRRDNEPTESNNHYQMTTAAKGNTEREKSKSAAGGSNNTPSFSLTSHKNFKFTPAEKKEPEYESPRKSRRYNEASSPSRKPMQNGGFSRSNSGSDTGSSPGKQKNKYVIDTRQERKNSQAKSPEKEKLGIESLHYSSGSPCRNIHEGDLLDSPSKYYPVKRTCDPKADPSYYESVSSSKKSSPRRGSPLKRGSTLSGNQSLMMSPDRSKDTYLTIVPDIRMENGKIVENKTEFPEGLVREVLSNKSKDGDDFRFDFQAIPTVSSKYDNFREDGFSQVPMTRSSLKPSETSPERDELLRQSKTSSKGTSTAYFGIASGLETPQKDVDILYNPHAYKAVGGPAQAQAWATTNGLEQINNMILQATSRIDEIEKKKHDNEAYYSFQKDGLREQFTFDNKRPRLSTEGVNNVNQQNKDMGPKGINGDNTRNYAGDKGIFSARSSVQEEWQSVKDIPNLQSLALGTSGAEPKRFNKYVFAPQSQTIKIGKLPNDKQITMLPKDQFVVREEDTPTERTDRSLKAYGIQLDMGPGGDLRPPKDMKRSLSASKLHNRPGDLKRQVSGTGNVDKRDYRSKPKYDIIGEDDISEEKTENIRNYLMADKRNETKRASAQNDFSGSSIKRKK